MLSHATSNDQRIDPSLALYSRGSNVPVTQTSRPFTIAPCCVNLSTVSASRPKVETRYHAVLSWSPRRRLTARLNDATSFPDGRYFHSGSLPIRPINWIVERFAMLVTCPFCCVRGVDHLRLLRIAQAGDVRVCLCRVGHDGDQLLRSLRCELRARCVAVINHDQLHILIGPAEILLMLLDDVRLPCADPLRASVIRCRFRGCKRLRGSYAVWHY